MRKWAKRYTANSTFPPPISNCLLTRQSDAVAGLEDFTVTCKGRKFLVHKVFLACASDFFGNCFKHCCRVSIA